MFEETYTFLLGPRLLGTAFGEVGSGFLGACLLVFLGLLTLLLKLALLT